jgi:hypothetical protein
MIDTNELLELFSSEKTLTVVPNGLKRIVIPVFGFDGARTCTYTDQDGKEKTGTGLTFFNPKDCSLQFIKQEDGCLILYDGSGRQEKISKYLIANPDVLKTAKDIQNFIKYIKENVVADFGKADLWSADTRFISTLKNAPEQKDVTSGKIFVLEKEQKPVIALYVTEGVSVSGAAASLQTAGKGGAYIIKETDNEGRLLFRLIQKEEFKKAYKIIERNDEKNSGHKKGS